jgi:hypothetical protein
MFFETHKTLLAAAAFAALTIATLYAQEPQMFNRGVSVLQGNITASRGYVYSGGSPSRDYRTVSTESTAGAATYTAAQVLTGLIARTPGAGGNVTDVLPTAANLAAAIPGVAAGHSFWLVVDMGASPGGTVTLNGASTGVTYAGGCATAQGTLDAMPVLITFTSATAYRATCINVNT